MTTLEAIEVTEALDSFIDAKIEYALQSQRDSHEHITSTNKVDKTKFELLELLESLK